MAMVIRIILIIYNVFWGPLPGSDKDAIGFIRGSYQLLENRILPEKFFGGYLYEFFLALSFKYLIETILFVISLNNIIFIISLALCLKTLSLLKITENYRIIAILILLLYPSLTLNTVTTLREPFQFFFISAIVYLYVFLIKRNFSFFVFIMLQISILLLGVTHNGLLVMVPILSIITSLVFLRGNINQVYKSIILIWNILFTSIIIILFTKGTISSPVVDALFNGEGVEYAEEYREKSPDGRTTYEGSISFINPIVGTASSFLVFFKYFTYPFPWQITSVKDIIPLMENIVRLFFLLYVLKSISMLGNLKLLFIVFITLEFLWSLGTSNWGTGSRHHIIQSQILIILFIYIKQYKINADCKIKLDT